MSYKTEPIEINADWGLTNLLQAVSREGALTSVTDDDVRVFQENSIITDKFSKAFENRYLT